MRIAARSHSALALLFVAAALCAPAHAGESPPPIAAPNDIPTLEPAPRIEMHEFDAFKTPGTGEIAGVIDGVPTKAFGTRKFLGARVYIVPQTTYSQYVADEAREAWLRGRPMKFDRGVAKFIRATSTNANAQFRFEKLPAGNYVFSADLAESKADVQEPCVGSYAGYDPDGKPTSVSVGRYCYGKIVHDYLFVTGSARVVDNAQATVTFDNIWEVVQ